MRTEVYDQANEITSPAFTRALRALFLVILLGSSACSDKPEEPSGPEKNPNVLIIYPDQLRRYSAGFWSEEPYRQHVVGKPDPAVTPNIDRLASEGIVFTHAVSNFPLCSPARGMLLTGRFPEQNGIWNNCRKDREDSLRDDVPTMTDLFYKAGYNTAYFGKCHWLKNDPLFDAEGNYVGSTEEPGGHFMNDYDTYVPPGRARHNIEHFFQAIKDEHFNPRIYSNDPDAVGGNSDGEIYYPQDFSTKVEAESIVAYLENEKGKRDGEKPFFIFWSINPPHNPWDDANTDMETLRAHYDVDRFPSIDSSLVVRKNADLEVAQYARHYFANVTAVDREIGHVLDELERMDVLDNTIVVFSSDHGEMLGSHGLRGKNTFETESLAIPLIVHWPEGLSGTGNSESQTGAVNSIVFSVTDLLPTLMGLAGLDALIPTEVEGFNHAASIFDPDLNRESDGEGALLMIGNSRGIYTPRYTLCLKEKKKPWDAHEVAEIDEVYLYDLEQDPYQQTRIQLDEKPDISKKLLTQLGRELKRSNDPWYQERKYADLIIYPDN